MEQKKPVRIASKGKFPRELRQHIRWRMRARKRQSARAVLKRYHPRAFSSPAIQRSSSETVITPREVGHAPADDVDTELTLVEATNAFFNVEVRCCAQSTLSVL